MNGKLSEAELAALLACEGLNGWTPTSIVSVASDPDNVLHARFTWDNGVAGHLFRLDEARQLIRLANIEVTVETQTLDVPLLVHDPTQTGTQCYRATQQLAADDPAKAIRVLLYTMSVGRGHLVRAQTLARIFRLDGSLGEVLTRLNEIMATLASGDSPPAGNGEDAELSAVVETHSDLA